MAEGLAERLRTLARLAEQGELPETTLRRLCRAAALAERDARLLAAAELAGGTAGLLEALEARGWRLPIWHDRGRAPEIADPVLLALFEAGSLPTPRHIRRILNGHLVSEGRD